MCHVIVNVIVCDCVGPLWASSHYPKTCRLGLGRLIGYSKLPVGVSVDCLCVSVCWPCDELVTCLPQRC